MVKTAFCLNCKKRFIYKSHKKKYCSDICRTRFISLRLYNLKKHDPEYKKNKIENFKNWYRKNKEKQKINILNDYKRNKDKWRIRKKNYFHRKEIFKIFNNSCVKCGAKENLIMKNLTFKDFYKNGDWRKNVKNNLMLLCKVCFNKTR